MGYLRFAFLVVLLSMAFSAVPGTAFAAEGGQRAPRQKKLKATSLTGWSATRKVSVRAHAREGRPVRVHTRKIKVD